MDQAAHCGLRQYPSVDGWVDEAASEPPHCDVFGEIRLRVDLQQKQHLKTGFAADALSALEPSTPATGSAATSHAEPVAGCAFAHSALVPPNSELPKEAVPKEAVIGRLRAAITKIECHGFLQDQVARAYPQAKAGWHLGCSPIDRLLPHGLDLGGVHEVKSSPHAAGASAGDWMAGLGFALRLAVRRALMFQRAQDDAQRAPWLLWCWPRAISAELGAPSALGLASLGLDPSRLLIVETARAAQALVALEDGLKSSSAALAFGIFDEIALTPARRLSLAAAATGTPCLLMTHPASAPSAATSTRWRVKRQQSAAHIYDARAPGNVRFLVGLERCRASPQNADPHNASHSAALLEWCDETRDFSLARRVADRAAGAALRQRCSG